MARIRTVKPDLFRHEGLFEAEQEFGLPLRLAFIGMFTACDRDGRFRWQPRQIKLDVMPYDSCDFSRVLDALASRGFIVRYACGDDEYGVIPSWPKHQVINNREKMSVYPGVEEASHVFNYENNELLTRESRVSDASQSCHGGAKGEGKGREGEQEGKGKGNARDASPDGFDGFWSLYPKKASKADALKAWKKLKPSEIELAIAALPNHCMSEQWTKDGGQFIPNAATWLNKKRWEDEVKQVVSRHEGFAQRDYFEGLTQREDGTYGL